jgi:two-component system sensor histidine kinase PilS (NtrC family)
MNIEAGPAPKLAVVQADLAWRIVGLTNLYRLLAVPVLLAVHLLTRPVPQFGQASPPLFRIVLGAYFVLAVVLALVGRRYWHGRRTLVFTHTLVDSSAVALLAYASGGVGSNLAILLVIPVGAMALLAIGRETLVLAAIASMAILAQQLAAVWRGYAGYSDFSVAGVMGLVVFLVAALSWLMASRLRESEEQVRQQEVDLANLAQLSQYILQRLRESLLVVDANDRIRLINESAALLLGPAALPGALLGEASPRLLYLLTTWRQRASGQASGQAGGESAEETSGTFASADGAQVLEPHFASLGAGDPAPALVFLEDRGALAARVQQSKLAALGRLTASIAHEIRNPVGAMSHAAQLMAEEPALAPSQMRLAEIVTSNARRVSNIIDNVQRLSRREPPRPESLVLAAWCERFRDEFCATLQCLPDCLPLREEELGVVARVDAGQLHQILWNLCENSLRHGQSGRSEPRVEITIGRVARGGRASLEVADRGPGIDAPEAERIFEPFYTRGAGGTGLGLYLARELAEINGATLLYEPRRGGGSVFRLVFADPTRWDRQFAGGA